MLHPNQTQTTVHSNLNLPKPRAGLPSVGKNLFELIQITDEVCLRLQWCVSFPPLCVPLWSRMCSLTRTTFRIRLGAVFVRVYGLGFDDAFLVMRCCFISVFPPPEEALFLYLWNFKGVWVQVCVCLTWLASEVYTYLVHTSVAGHVMCTCIIFIYI